MRGSTFSTEGSSCCAAAKARKSFFIKSSHPAALETGEDFAVRFFPSMYRRAAVVQASLALVGCAAALAAWLRGAGRMWLAVGVLLGSVVPFTLLVIKPVNDALMQGGDVSRPELGTLLVRWSYLHWARTVASGFAFLLCLVSLRPRE